MLFNLANTPSIGNQYIAELRDVNVQTDRQRFRRNLERLGEIFAYEISKTLPFRALDVTTPLGTATVMTPAEQPVVACILRAGLAMQTGMMDVFDHADNAFVSAYRRHADDGSFDIHVQYISCPSVHDRILVVSDPMLATGASIVKAVEFLSAYGTPKAVHIVAAIAAQPGVAYVQKHLPDAHIWVGAIDPELTPNAYITPGLGDAGDLAFGAKLQH